MAAPKQSDRVGSIGLTVTDPHLEHITAIDRPFPELEDRRLLPRDRMQLTLPWAFRWAAAL